MRARGLNDKQLWRRAKRTRKLTIHVAHVHTENSSPKASLYSYCTSLYVRLYAKELLQSRDGIGEFFVVVGNQQQKKTKQQRSNIMKENQSWWVSKLVLTEVKNTLSFIK
jgi:hypothetical protein